MPGVRTGQQVKNSMATQRNLQKEEKVNLVTKGRRMRWKKTGQENIFSEGFQQFIYPILNLTPSFLCGLHPSLAQTVQQISAWGLTPHGVIRAHLGIELEPVLVCTDLTSGLDEAQPGTGSHGTRSLHIRNA